MTVDRFSAREVEEHTFFGRQGAEVEAFFERRRARKPPRSLKGKEEDGTETVPARGRENVSSRR